MVLKPRSKPSGYESSDADFQLLKLKQDEYANYFLRGNTLWPSERYHTERNRIILEWQNKTVTSAMWTKEIELQELDIAFNAIKTKETVDRVIMSTLFAKIYSYFNSMVTDCEIGYLTDEKFEENMFQYNEAIEINKKLKLNCWRKSPVDEIEKTKLRIVRSPKQY